MSDSELFSTADVANELGITVAKFSYLVRIGVLPPGEVVAGRRVYRASQIGEMVDFLADYEEESQEEEEEEEQIAANAPDPDDDDDDDDED